MRPGVSVCLIQLYNKLSIFMNSLNPEALTFLKQIKAEVPQYFEQVNVLEYVSRDTYGSAQEEFNDLRGYVAIPIEPRATTIATEQRDVVISCSRFEFDPNWKALALRMYRNLKPGGLLVITCAGPERQSKEPGFKPVQMVDLRIMLGKELFVRSEIRYERGKKDLMFYGIKSQR